MLMDSRRVVWLFDSMSDRNRFIWFNWNFCANEIGSHWLCTRNARNDRLYFFFFSLAGRWAKLGQRTVKPRNAFKISRYLVFFRLILKEKRKQNIKYYLDMRHVHISGDRTSPPPPSPSRSAPRLNPFHLLAQDYDRKCVWLALGFVWVSVRQTLPYITMLDMHVHTHRQSALDWKTKPVKKRPVRVRKYLRKISWYSSRKKKKKTKKKTKK
jgi:hypothetical protein